MEGLTIGVCSPLLAGWYFGRMISAVGRAVSLAGGRAVAIQSLDAGRGDGDVTTPDELPHVGWERLAGFVTIINAVPASYLHALREAGKPVVMISWQEPGFACPSVAADNRTGVAQAVEHLLGHGHTQIAFVGCMDQHDMQERYAAYRETLLDYGIEPDPSWCYEASDSLQNGGQRACEAMLTAGLPCSAVVAANDMNAIGIIETLKAAGRSVPRDLAVVGFDDSPAAASMSPSLSTVTQHVEQIGTKVVELLQSQLRGESVRAGWHQVPTSLVVRESCGCAGSTLFASVPMLPDPCSAFVRALQDAFVSDAADELGADRVAELAGELGREITKVFCEAIEREPSQAELLRLSSACERLYALNREVSAVTAVLGLVRQLSRGLEATAAPGPSSARLDKCLVEVGLSLANARASAGSPNALWQSMREDYDISMDLLRSHEADPRSLAWLARTKAQAAHLVLWAPQQSPEARDEAREVEIVGTYDARGAECEVSSLRCGIEDFPSAELLERAEQEADSLAFLLPIKTKASDWGYLAVVGPTEESFTGRETYFQWAALLSQALDYEAVVQSLRHQREDLAQSYQREREMAKAVKESEERYALAARAANDGLWDWDLGTGSIYYSTRWKAMLDLDEDAVGDSPQEWLGRVHPDDWAGLLAAIDDCRCGGTSSFEFEHRVKAKDGRYRWVLARALGVPGDGAPAKRMVGSLTDITERRSLEEKLRHQALYDSLTGLPNRTLFLDRLAQAMAQSKRRPDYEYAVLWLDLDGFKVVNDSLGHLVGDLLLVRVAERIRSHLREVDTAARFGGDEFAVLLHHVSDFSLVEKVVHRLQESLSVPFDLDGHEVVVTGSIGIATSATKYENPEDVLRDADIAMYQAKSSGRGSSTTFDASMYAGAMSRLKTESELRQAVDNEQLELHYQPIVDLGTGALTAVEALIRWRHPMRGLVPPCDFLPVAEESSLIVPMGHWVQAEASRQVMSWKGASLVAPDLRMSINLSNREFWSSDLVAWLDQMLEQTGVPPSWLTFEITEGVIMHSLQSALTVMHELHERGMHIHIDDFGTGYSSLEALHRLPIEALKIDRSFVANLSNDDRSRELVRTIVQLGHNLGVEVIAEGIETPDQQEMLHEIGCPWGQGYWFSRPLPAAQFDALLANTGIGPVACLSPS
jgi:diguanylate cyclase (GGDEF)-like protein/PAS domain S-box-containing protein